MKVLHGLFGLFLAFSAFYSTLEILVGFGAGRLFAGVVGAVVWGATVMYVDRPSGHMMHRQ